MTIFEDTNPARSFSEARPLSIVSPEEHVSEVLGVILEQCVAIIRVRDELSSCEQSLHQFAH